MDEGKYLEYIDFNKKTFLDYELKHYMLPVNFWKEFPKDLLDTVNDSSKWKSFKVLNDDGSINNVGFSMVNNTCGGVYSFVVIPSVFNHNQKALLYIGVATLTPTENLRNRISAYKQYVGEKENPFSRSFLSREFFLWKDYLHCVYHEMPGEDSETIKNLEKNLIWALEPPCNPDQEGFEPRSIGRKAAFGA